MQIRIKDKIIGNTAISYEAGTECYNEIIKRIDEVEVIELDFEGVDYVITAFLNPIIGDLIINKGNEALNKIKIINANEEIIKKIKQVKDGALLKREDMD